MKIQIVSDLHNEFGVVKKNYDAICSGDADVLVLAGDISSNEEIVDDILHFQEDSGKHIVFVPGNHEYYRTSRKALDKEMFLLEDINPKVHVLIEKDFCMGGVCFLGSTGWWDGSFGSIGVNQINGLNDFRMIYDLMDEGNLDGIKWGRMAQTYLSGRMHYMRHNFPDTKLCVVTHHYPTERSIHPAFAGSPLNACFCNNWEWMIDKYRPELWIHGHTHMPFDYTMGSCDGHPHLRDKDDTKRTRIVCNPQGYPKEYGVPKAGLQAYFDSKDMELLDSDLEIYTTTENVEFEPQKVVEL
jgi:predicted phosphohydrolase